MGSGAVSFPRREQLDSLHTSGPTVPWRAAGNAAATKKNWRSFADALKQIYLHTDPVKGH